MKALAKYWKLLLAVILVVATVFVYINKYKAEKTAFEAEVVNLGMMVTTLENKIQENMKYADIQDQLEDAKAQLKLSVTPIKEIAISLGFENVAFFNRFFKTHVGTTPKNYRNS